MRISGDGFQVSYEDNTLTLRGKLSLMLEDYADIDRLFKTVVDTNPGSLLVDIRELEYLNSAGIHSLCVKLILEAAEIEGFGITILCSNRYTWQEETIPTLEDLMENLAITFE